MPVLRRAWSALFIAVLAGCASPPASAPQSFGTRAATDTPSQLVTVTVMATNDIHGAVDRMPYLAGYIDILRRERRAIGSDIVLIDSGDISQGTLASNLGEGAAMIDAMNAMEYTAAAVGNHEFDFGPVGKNATPQTDEDDPRGALKARAKQAQFPLLAANILNATSGARVDWDNIPATHTVTVSGIKIGIVGLVTKDLLTTTIAHNVRGLRVASLAKTAQKHADELRAAGVGVVIVAAHAGGKCQRFESASNLESCAPNQEIFEVARALRPGSVDIIVAGHTHAGVAHIVNGIAIIEQYAHGRAFGRVDLAVNRLTGRAVQRRVFPPRSVCESPKGPCKVGTYEGEQVVPNPKVLAIAKAADAAAKPIRDQSLDVTLTTPITRTYDTESAAGNWLATHMLRARPKADIALTNGGGLRADVPAGDLTYGRLYRLTPFDNRYAWVSLTGAQLATVFRKNLAHDRGMLSLAGATVTASCSGNKLNVAIVRDNGKPIGATESVKVLMSDFLAVGGDPGITLAVNAGAKVTVEGESTIRDAVADAIRKSGGSAKAVDFYNPDSPRVRYPGLRPVTCK